MQFLLQYHIIIIGGCFFALLAGMTWVTHTEKKWIRDHYPKEDIVAIGFGILCYGLASEAGSLKKRKGFLLIHKGGLLFKQRFSDVRFQIPADAILKVYHGTSHREKRLYQSAVKVDYKIPGKPVDTIAFKLAYPPQWIKIIGKTFIRVKENENGNQSVTD